MICPCGYRPRIYTRLTCLFMCIIFLGTKFLFHGFRHSGDAIDFRSQNILLSDDIEYDFRRHLLAMKVHRPHPTSNCTPLAVENFPRDLFKQSQRQKGAVILHIIGAVYMFIGLALLCDDYFIPCLERISEVLNLQPDVAGATFMAAGSSAPELATTLVGVFIAKDDIGLGAVVGSADFNVMLVVSVTALFAKHVIYLNWWPLVRDCSFYLISIILLAIVIVDEKIYWYEALFLLLFYGAYVVLMYFNPKLDRFWHTWCQNHPACCPRAHHTEDEMQEIVQQHSGAFAQPATDSGNVLAPASHMKYERLAGDLEPNPVILRREVAAGEKFAGSLEVPEVLSTEPYSISEVQTQVKEPCESWFETCFGLLHLPRSQGVRGKIHYFACLSVWPLRLLLCLTVPDVRRPRWRRMFISHWLSFVMCCVWIGLFTVIMMWMITVIGVTFHIPDTIMGLTFIAAGSSVPDAIASILVVREGEGDMAVSNAVGSNVFDILICMGLPWFLKCVISGAPVVIYSKGLLYAVLTLFSTVLFLLVVTHLNRWRLTKPYGITLLMGYIIVLVFCSCYELNLFGTVHLPECPLIE
ncbi:unnamed protein product [Dicrocoelium dendriticum]|nr:unnamed protein product [Dicrocoelium dendriticum]